MKLVLVAALLRKSIEVPPSPMPPIPTAAWIILGLGLGALALAARRGCEKSPAPRAAARTGGFRSQPHDDVMLVEVA